ncbi:helix-turn-helix transcriptional regulator [Lachnospiraceae bacterium KK002]
MDFYIRLENLIEERNLTQKQLSLDLHIASSTVNGYVNNNREPDFATLVRFAQYFNVSTDYLLGLSSEKKPSPSSLSPAEGALIHLYRSLPQERQELIVEQAKFYQNLEQKRQKASKTRSGSHS